MKSKIMIVSALVYSAIALAPAQANWFSNQKSNTAYNIGSVRNPTVADIRAYRHEYDLGVQSRQAKVQGAGSVKSTPVTESDSASRSFWGLFR